MANRLRDGWMYKWADHITDNLTCENKLSVRFLCWGKDFKQSLEICMA